MEKKFYCLYQITNKVNGKIYVGVHGTDDLEDGYMGSGKLIKAAVAKYGLENFEKTILETFSSSEEMFEREAEVVTAEFVAQENSYNLHNGGAGFNSMFSQLAKEARSAEDFKLAGERAWQTKLIRYGGHHPDFEVAQEINRGADHLQETRKLAQTPEARRKRVRSFEKIQHQQREKNSQFGSVWITDGEQNAKIKVTDSIPAGWRKGRTLTKSGVDKQRGVVLVC